MMKWQCTNPGCEDRKNGIIAFSMDPGKCDKCGSRMEVIGGPDAVFVVGGDAQKSKDEKKWWQFWK